MAFNYFSRSGTDIGNIELPRKREARVESIERKRAVPLTSTLNDDVANAKLGPMRSVKFVTSKHGGVAGCASHPPSEIPQTNCGDRQDESVGLDRVARRDSFPENFLLLILSCGIFAGLISHAVCVVYESARHRKR